MLRTGDRAEGSRRVGQEGTGVGRSVARVGVGEVVHDRVGGGGGATQQGLPHLTLQLAGEATHGARVSAELVFMARLVRVQQEVQLARTEGHSKCLQWWVTGTYSIR